MTSIWCDCLSFATPYPSQFQNPDLQHSAYAHASVQVVLRNASLSVTSCCSCLTSVPAPWWLLVQTDSKTQQDSGSFTPRLSPLSFQENSSWETQHAQLLPRYGVRLLRPHVDPVESPGECGSPEHTEAALWSPTFTGGHRYPRLHRAQGTQGTASLAVVFQDTREAASQAGLTPLYTLLGEASYCPASPSPLHSATHPLDPSSPWPSYPTLQPVSALMSRRPQF